MRNFALKAILLGFAAITVGCIHPIRNTNNQMQSWVGHHESELIQAWGPANSISPDGAGGHVLIYYIDKTYTTPDTRQTVTETTTGPYASCGSVGGVPLDCQNTQATSTSRTVGQAPQRAGYVAQRMFYVDKSGVIYWF